MYMNTPSPELEEIVCKFPDTYQIVEMLNYFQRQHNESQSALHASGEGWRCKPFDIQIITMYQISNQRLHLRKRGLNL